jgi:putative ABC transport system permease protein
MRSETWKLAWEALRANTTRAVLTMLGVIIGSACIVLVVSVALAGKKYVLAQIEGVGANIVYAELTGSNNNVPADEITPADLQAVEQGIPEVTRAAGTHDLQMTVVANSQERPVNVVGVTDEFQSIRNLQVLQGRYFDSDEMELRSKVCLITKDLAKVAFPAGDAIGKEIRAGELSFTVIGIFQERVATFGQSEITSESLLIPFTLIKYYTGQDYFRTFYAQATSPDDVPLVTNEIGDILRERHRPEAKYTVQNLAGILAAAEQISLALTLVLLLVAMVVLAVSGVGIMNIMLVTVTERTREIGIRMAVGARRSDILCQFLMEAVLISGTGSIAGILVGVAIPFLVNFALRFFPEAANVSLPLSGLSVLAALFVACSTGLVFGFLPANRAAKLHPTESLRYE